MKYEFTSFRLHALPEPLPENDLVYSLSSALTKQGFDEMGVGQLVEMQHEGNQTLTVALRACSKDKTSVSLLVRLFLMSLRVDRESVNQALGPILVTRLCQWGLLADLESNVAATVDIHPCRGLQIATDHGIAADRKMDAVYPLGGDSHILARLAPRAHVELALDLATGSGVHAILAAKHSNTVHAVDISPRAVAFASFNSKLNQQEKKIEFFLGDLFEALPKKDYDLIVSNLPWVPTPPEKSELYRSGGQDGENLTKRVVESLSERLRPEGWMAMYVEYPEFADNAYLERVQSWLTEGQWGTVLLNIKHWSASSYVMTQVSTHAKEDLIEVYDRWMTSYEARGIKGMKWAMLYITKLGPDRKSWSVEREAEFPHANEAKWVSNWLHTLNEGHACGGFEDSSQVEMAPDVEFWFEQQSGCGAFSWPETCLKVLRVEPNLATTAQKILNGVSCSVEELRELAKLGVLQGTRPLEPGPSCLVPESQ